MRASEAQIAANKANALKSTGPKTAEGKAAVSNNALKHDLSSARNPTDLQRAVRMDTAHMEMHAGLINNSTAQALPPDEQTRNNWLSTLAFLKNPSATTLIAQYESRLSRDFARTLAQFRAA